MSAPAELLADLAAVLRRRRIRWYVFGAQAVVAYGRPRMTADVDVTIGLEPARLPALVRDLAAAGFRVRIPGFVDLLAAARVVPMVHTPTSMPLDVVLSGPGLEEEFLDRARVVDVGGARVPMISPEDLVATKILAGRPKDLDDVVGILAERGRLDLARIRDVLTALEGALDQSDLIPMFERLQRDARASRPRPRPRKRRT